jgi:hypothetical protein
MSSRTQLLEILDGGVKEAAFEVFLKRIYCAENLDFYRAALKYEQIVDESERKLVAEEMCKIFIYENSVEQINVECQIVVGMN